MRLLLAFFLIICTNFVVIAQRNPYVLLQTGATLYQGDLAPKPLDSSFGNGNFSCGIGVGFFPKSWLDLSFSYNRGRLSGDDKYADSEGRRDRNLSFFSPIHHVGINTCVDVNHFFKSLDKYNLRWYFGTGLGYDFFDPRTTFKGNTIRLQPLGTEGQNLEGHKSGPYSLSTFVTQLGLKVMYNVNDKFSVGLEAWSTKTRTDYIDDVSTSYPDLDYFKEEQQWLSYYMSDRSSELQSVPSAQPGQGRGNPNKNDSYVRVGLVTKYTLPKKAVAPALPLIPIE